MDTKLFFAALICVVIAVAIVAGYWHYQETTFYSMPVENPIKEQISEQTAYFRIYSEGSVFPPPIPIAVAGTLLAKYSKDGLIEDLKAAGCVQMQQKPPETLQMPMEVYTRTGIGSFVVQDYKNYTFLYHAPSETEIAVAVMDNGTLSLQAVYVPSNKVKLTGKMPAGAGTAHGTGLSVAGLTLGSSYDDAMKTAGKAHKIVYLETRSRNREEYERVTLTFPRGIYVYTLTFDSGILSAIEISNSAVPLGWRLPKLRTKELRKAVEEQFLLDRDMFYDPDTGSLSLPKGKG